MNTGTVGFPVACDIEDVNVIAFEPVAEFLQALVRDNAEVRGIREMKEGFASVRDWCRWSAIAPRAEWLLKSFLIGGAKCRFGKVVIVQAAPGILLSLGLTS